MADLFTHSSQQFSYSLEGEGDRTIIAFHGFGGNTHSFDFLKGTHRLIQIELYGHGASRSDLPTKDIQRGFLEAFSHFLSQQQIEQFDLVGFSIGAKPVIALYEYFSKRVTSVALLAPDGIYQNPWYWLATRTALGRLTYRNLMKRGKSLETIVDYLERSKWTNPALLRFVKRGIKDANSREQVLNTWISYQSFVANRKTLAKVILSNGTIFCQVYGERDPVIKWQPGLRLAHTVGQEHNFHLLKAGHNLIDNAQGQAIIKDLLK